MHIFGWTAEEIRDYELNYPYKWLAQPIEWKNKIQNKKTFQVYDLKTKKIKEEYLWKTEHILEYLDKKYLSSNLWWPIWDTIKWEAEDLFKKIIKTK